ncbi:MAG: VanZ family protein [Verrucomicrobiota bacterium]
MARKPLLWWFAVLVWAVVLWNLSANATLPSGPSFPLKDKVLHCTYFGMGAACFLLALFGKGTALPKKSHLGLGGFLFTGIIGALDEYHQTFTPGRSGNDPWDWLADVTGGLIAAWIIGRLLLRIMAGLGSRRSA